MTACLDKPEFKIWRFWSVKRFEFHLKINTTLEGISHILQTTPEQIVCVDRYKTLKFYNFQDRSLKQNELKFEKDLKTFQIECKKLTDHLELDI